MNTTSQNSLVPYAVGAGIGLLNVAAFLSAKRGIGVTTAFESVAAKIEQAGAPDVTNINSYLKEVEKVPKIDWESFLVIGIPLGSFLATRIAGEHPSNKFPSAWVEKFGESRAKRYVGAFLGGAAVMFGARMAKGCTSGHGITGTSQLAVSSLIFTPLMFAVASFTAEALYQRGCSRVSN